MALGTDSQQEMIESLTYRLDKLQNTIAGPSDIYHLKNMPFCALKMASRIQNQIDVFEDKWKNTKSLSDRLDEMGPYLQTMDTEGVKEDSLREVLALRAEEIRQQARDYERLEQLKEYAGGVSIDTGSLQPRVRPLIEVSVDQETEAQGLTSQVQELVTRYNAAISAISNQFLVVDELLAKLESKK